MILIQNPTVWLAIQFLIDNAGRQDTMENGDI